MLRLVVLGLILACAVSLSSSAVILENGMPIHWAQTASQVTELPIQDGILYPNPWNYLHRMSLYRLMIAATDPFMGSMGTNATDSPLWGLALQLGWMLTSGRFADPTSATTCGLPTGEPLCISTQSWWGCVEYFTSALPFLSAAQQGLMGSEAQVQMQVPAGVHDYCTTHASCKASYPGAMAAWDAFFEGLKSMSEAPLSDDVKKDSILGLYWTAQIASSYALAACNARQSHYSSEEMSFAKSWLNSAEFVSAARFQSNMARAVLFLSPLPSRVLLNGDSAPNIADLSQEENHTLYIFNWMKNINSLLGGSMVSLWKSAMCSVSSRQKGAELLEQLLLNPSFATSTFFSIISEMTTSC